MAKFPWGGQAFEICSVVVGVVLGTALVGIALVITGPGGSTGDQFPGIADLRSLAVVTGVWVIVWYTLLGNQVAVRFVEGKPKEEAAAAAHIALRAVVNSLEQSLPFLVLIWLHAIFVNPRTSVPLAWIFVVCRFFYPFAYGMYGQMSSAVEIPQQICYVDIYYLLYALLYKCCSGNDLHSAVMSISPVLIFVVAFLAGAGVLLTFLGLTIPANLVIYAGVKWDQEYEEDEEEMELGSSEA